MKIYFSIYLAHKKHTKNATLDAYTLMWLLHLFCLDECLNVRFHF